MKVLVEEIKNVSIFSCQDSETLYYNVTITSEESQEEKLFYDEWQRDMLVAR